MRRVRVSDPSKCPRADRELEVVTSEVHRTLRTNMGPTGLLKNKPAEDFARATVNYVDEENNPLIVEVTTS